MNETKLKHRLNQQLHSLSTDQLNRVCQFVENLSNEISPTQLDEILLNKWQYLLEKGQELNPEQPLTETEITQIRHLLYSLNQSCPIGLAQGEFTVSDNFNDPLPDDILASFYPS